MNKCNIKVYSALPDDAKEIRTEVFVDEQGFTEEFDSADKSATHLVGYIGEKAVATSRIIEQSDGSFLIGRIAVRNQYRKSGFGAEIIAASEKVIADKGGKTIFIHSQLQAAPFYAKQGYSPTGETDEEEGCPHCMMQKTI